MDFSTGTCSLPTRITCYCRHHKEKLGFKIVLVVKDSQGTVIGQCISGNIMITDDHKAQSGKTGDDQPVNKRRSSEEGRTTSGFISRRSSMDSIDSQSMTSSGTEEEAIGVGFFCTFSSSITYSSYNEFNTSWHSETSQDSKEFVNDKT